MNSQWEYVPCRAYSLEEEFKDSQHHKGLRVESCYASETYPHQNLTANLQNPGPSFSQEWGRETPEVMGRVHCGSSSSWPGKQHNTNLQERGECMRVCLGAPGIYRRLNRSRRNVLTNCIHDSIFSVLRIPWICTQGCGLCSSMTCTEPKETPEERQ
ncbi:hypothetical protein H1C71_000227 [Ictidomys tridecemlineatus]|nr:hypothetical protein H1C71_000227 [Ictidomys tridecemlineatus]